MFNGSSPRLPPSLEPIYIQLAQRIKEARLKTGMTQRTLASKVGLSRVSIVNIEAARQRVSLMNAEQIASALGVQLSELNEEQMTEYKIEPTPAFVRPPAERQGSSPLITRSRATKFTPERLQQIKNLVERGKSRGEIADILAVTVGSLQVTCSKMGISLRRPKIDDGVGLLRKRTPLLETSHHPSDHNGGVPSQPTEEQSLGNSQSEPAVIGKRQEERATTPDACSASFAIRFHYRGMERTAELPLTTHTIGQVALAAALRDVTIGELIAELITAMVNKDLFLPVLDNIGPDISRVDGGGCCGTFGDALVIEAEGESGTCRTGSRSAPKDRVGQAKRFSNEVAEGVKRSADMLQQLALGPATR